MKIFSDIKSIKSELSKHSDKKIGFIPTMGALHNGHLSLIKQARKCCDLLVVSIFINQKQFNNQQDYSLYPQNIDQDIRDIENIADILFCPKSEEIYPLNFATHVKISNLTDNLCGKTRLGHFDGVALIITKLFNIIKPHQAFFGEKDFQQLQIIKKLVKDLSSDVEIIGCETIRETDGLAMSSRNSRLSINGRKIAANIYAILCEAKIQILQKENLPSLIITQMTQKFYDLGLNKIDYFEMCDEENLQPISIIQPDIKSRLFIAIYVDEIRLIDNIKLY